MLTGPGKLSGVPRNGPQGSKTEESSFLSGLQEQKGFGLRAPRQKFLGSRAPMTPPRLDTQPSSNLKFLYTFRCLSVTTRAASSFL